ncbi:MAG: hypothetical protein BEN19_07810 [Epulopiscium sp. Nuni2H_MBin003]|nr:MAG: hypothetical protein BEN19_07810 [Epulopiscium sp. Nuni2H_MBin003]
MKKLLELAIDTLKTTDSIVLATIIYATGSTPREAGAIMLVSKDGPIGGTVGGGTVEHESIELAKKLLHDNACGFTKRFILDTKQAGSLGMVCGGTTDILFTPINDSAPLEHALKLIQNNTSIGALKFSLTGDNISCDNQADINITAKDAEFFYLSLKNNRRIILFGAGHVGTEVAHMLAYLDINYVIFDDRDEFLSIENFPTAQNRHVINFSELNSLNDKLGNISDTDGFCIMTRGHVGDLDVARFALNTKAGYIGLMGSDTKKKYVFDTLQGEGYSTDRINCPIGLSIGAQTPKEIAISVVSQILKWKYNLLH